MLPVILHENDIFSSLLSNLGTISQLLFTVLFIALFFGFGQKLQMRQFLWDIDKGLRKLDMFRNSAKDLTGMRSSRRMFAGLRRALILLRS